MVGDAALLAAVPAASPAAAQAPFMVPAPAPSGSPTPAPALAPAPGPSPIMAPVPSPTDSPMPAPMLAPSPSDSPMPAPMLAPALAPSPTDGPMPAPMLAPAPSNDHMPAPMHAPSPSDSPAGMQYHWDRAVLPQCLSVSVTLLLNTKHQTTSISCRLAMVLETCTHCQDRSRVKSVTTAAPGHAQMQFIVTCTCTGATYSRQPPPVSGGNEANAGCALQARPLPILRQRWCCLTWRASAAGCSSPLPTWRQRRPSHCQCLRLQSPLHWPWTLRLQWVPCQQWRPCL